MAANPRALLFDEGFLRRLERLAVAARRTHLGQQRGEHLSPARGAAIEFADYRDYTPGDDLRRVDWNVAARLDRVLIKLHQADEQLTVHVLLDTSASMDWGTPHKLTYGCRAAAALSYLTVSGHDRAALSTFSAEGLRQSTPFHSKRQLARMLDFLAESSPGGTTDLNRRLSTYAARARAPGPLFLISDLLAPAGCADGLRALAAAGYEVTVLHVLAPEEINPPLNGNLRLVDRETGLEREVAIDEALLRAYAQRLREWRDQLLRLCLDLQSTYVPIVSDQPFEELILGMLRRAGVIGH